MSLRPVNTLKHIVDVQEAIPAGTEQDTILVNAVENAVSTNAPDCDIGSHVRSLYLNVQVVNAGDGSGSIENAYMYLYGNPGTQIPTGSYPTVNTVGQSDLRKMIFHQEMRMLSNVGDSIPITLFAGVIKIPRKFSRLGVNDNITIRVGTPTGGVLLNACIQCVYKEIR